MSAGNGRSAELSVDPLTRREREILALLAQGYTGPEIADRLTLALSSVRWHLKHLYAKLGVNSKRQALDRARQLGLLEPPSATGAASSRAKESALAPLANLPIQI